MQQPGIAQAQLPSSHTPTPNPEQAAQLNDHPGSEHRQDV